MLDGLVDLVWSLDRWSYVVLFVGAALESSAFLGFVVPGETLVIVAGVMASAGVLDPVVAMVVAAGGGIIGDSVGYELGRHLGRAWIVRHGARFGLGRRTLARADALFARHGGKAVLLGRFVGFLRAMAPFVAGSSRMPYPTFLAFNAAGAVLWAVAAVWLGYAVGESWRVVERWIGRAGLVLGVVLVGLAVLWIRRGRRTRRGRRGPTRSAPDG